MSSPLLVTKAEVEDINRALIDLAGQRSVSVSGAPGGETIKLLPMATEVAYTIQANEKATTFLITTGSASDFTINFADQGGMLGRVFDFYKIDAGTKEVVLAPLASPQQYVNGVYTSVRAGSQGYHTRVVGTSSGWWIISQYLQSVSGEPSLGTPHEHHYVIYTNTSIGAGTTTTIDLSAQVPVGVKWIFLWFTSFRGAGGNVYIKNTAETVTYVKVRQAASVHAGAQTFVVLDSSRKFKFINDIAITELDMELVGYWI